MFKLCERGINTQSVKQEGDTTNESTYRESSIDPLIGNQHDTGLFSRLTCVRNTFQ